MSIGPSSLARSVLERGADAFMTMGEDLAPEAMRALAAGANGDPLIVAGESGAAGLAARMSASRSGEHSRRLGLDADARGLVFDTEGATDEQIHARAVAPLRLR